MHSLGEAVTNYFVSVYSTMTFLNRQQQREHRNQLKRDIGKCVLIGSAMFVAWNFGKGKTHYLKYLWKASQGAVFGLAYSFHFTAKKVENWRVDQLYARMIDNQCNVPQAVQSLL